MKRLLSLGLSLSFLILPGLAFAADGYVTSNANLRSGPNAGYPRVVGLSAGTPVEIYGCVNDWSWCDIGAGRERGWISAGLIAYSDNSQYWSVYDRGQDSHLPIITFIFATYWDSYYRGRPWYDRRPYWNNYRPIHRPPPPRPVRPPRPIKPPRPIGPPHPGNGGPQIQPPRPIQPPKPVLPPRPIQPPRPVQPTPRPTVQPPRPMPKPMPTATPRPRPLPATTPTPMPKPKPGAVPAKRKTADSR